MPKAAKPKKVRTPVEIPDSSHWLCFPGRSCNLLGPIWFLHKVIGCLGVACTQVKNVKTTDLGKTVGKFHLGWAQAVTNMKRHDTCLELT